MPDLIEVVPGTCLLFPVVCVLFVCARVPIQYVLGIAALLAVPVGWLALQIEGFWLSYRGRYEKESTMKHIRRHITFERGSEGKRTVDLSKILGSSFPNTVIACENQDEFDRLFDPFRRLKRCPRSFRKQQQSEGCDLPYVENIENLIFFSKEAHSRYIRELVRYWHIGVASIIGLSFGTVIAIGTWLTIQPSKWILGTLILVVSVAILLGLSFAQTVLRKKEALANEYLLLKLMVPSQECQPIENRGQHGLS
jgi:hypothetical protein